MVDGPVGIAQSIAEADKGTGSSSLGPTETRAQPNGSQNKTRLRLQDRPRPGGEVHKDEDEAARLTMVPALSDVYRRTGPG